MNPCLEILKLYPRIYMKLFQLKCAPGGSYPLSSGAKIITPNHPNSTDGFFLPFILREDIHFLMRSKAFSFPFIGNLLRSSGQIEVQAQNGQAAFQRACEVLNSGGTIVIFPQGKYSRDCIRGEGRTGAVRMSLTTGAPIIPLGIHVPPGNIADLRKHRFRPFGPGCWQFSGTCTMRFGKEWRPCLRDGANIHSLTYELMMKIEILAAEAGRESQCESQCSLNPIPQL